MPNDERSSGAVESDSGPEDAQSGAAVQLADIRQLVDQLIDGGRGLPSVDRPPPSSVVAAERHRGLEKLRQLVPPGASHPLAELSGTVLEQRYRLGQPLGSGGMGVVFEAVHLRLERTVAIKVLRPRFAAKAHFIKRFLREAKAASKIRHRNVVEILDYGETSSGLVYSVMEFLEGRDLRELLREQPEHRLPWASACELLLHIAGGLRAAHRQGVVHRDVKPANCFLTEEDGEVVVKVVDFGLAKVKDAGEETALTTATQLLGTPGYLAPELANGKAPATPQSDIYAFGVVAYRMLTGMLPFWGPSVHETLRMTCNDPVPSLCARAPELPPSVEAFVLGLLTKDPARRPSTMTEVRERLVQLGQRTLGQSGRFHGSLGGVTETATGQLAAPPNFEQEQTVKTVPRAHAPSSSSNAATLPIASTPMPSSGVATTSASSQRARGLLWLVLGLVVVSAAAVATAWWGLQSDGPTPAAGTVARTREQTPEVVPPEPVSPRATTPVEPRSLPDPLSTDVPAPEATTPSAAEASASEPEGHSKPRRRKNVRTAGVPKPVPADSVVIAGMERKIARKCAPELRGGPATVKFAVTPSGEMMALTATGPAGACARVHAKGTKFRARTATTPFKLVVK